MRGFLGRFGGRFGLGKALAAARSAEARGELAEAAALYARAARPDEAARLMIVRGDGETDPAARLSRYVQAVATAPPGSPVAALARRKRAEHLLALSEGAPATATLRHDLREAAADLEAAGLPALAALAWSRTGDGEGEARALAAAGEVDRLDALLSESATRDRQGAAARERHARFAELVASGRRRQAHELARASGDESLRERARKLTDGRVVGDVVRATVRGQPLRIALGGEVVVGRVATVAVLSAAVSRRHVALLRRGDDVVLRDLGTRNGTTLRGLALGGDVVVGEGLEVKLGGEVPLTVRPSSGLPGAVSIEIAGETWTAPLGPARLGVGAWVLEQGADGWIELVTDDAPPAFAGGLSVDRRVELLAGDAFATERDGEAALAVDAP